jgi:hypothetical protein
VPRRHRSLGTSRSRASTRACRVRATGLARSALAGCRSGGSGSRGAGWVRVPTAPADVGGRPRQRDQAASPARGDRGRLPTPPGPVRRPANRADLEAQVGSIRAGCHRIPDRSRRAPRGRSERETWTNTDSAGPFGRDCRSAVYDCRGPIPLVPTTPLGAGKCVGFWARGADPGALRGRSGSVVDAEVRGGVSDLPPRTGRRHPDPAPGRDSLRPSECRYPAWSLRQLSIPTG